MSCELSLGKYFATVQVFVQGRGNCDGIELLAMLFQQTIIIEEFEKLIIKLNIKGVYKSNKIFFESNLQKATCEKSFFLQFAAFKSSYKKDNFKHLTGKFATLVQ